MIGQLPLTKKIVDLIPLDLEKHLLSSGSLLDIVQFPKQATKDVQEQVECQSYKEKVEQLTRRNVLVDSLNKRNQELIALL